MGRRASPPRCVGWIGSSMVPNSAGQYALKQIQTWIRRGREISEIEHYQTDVAQG